VKTRVAGGLRIVNNIAIIVDNLEKGLDAPEIFLSMGLSDRPFSLPASLHGS
jgi:hypothetical protein